MPLLNPYYHSSHYRDELRSQLSRKNSDIRYQVEAEMSGQFVNLKKACDDLQDSRRQLEVQHSNLQVRRLNNEFLKHIASSSYPIHF